MFKPHSGQGWQLYCSTCRFICFYSKDGTWKHGYGIETNHEPTMDPKWGMIPPAYGCAPANVAPYLQYGKL